MMYTNTRSAGDGRLRNICVVDNTPAKNIKWDEEGVLFSPDAYAGDRKVPTSFLRLVHFNIPCRYNMHVSIIYRYILRYFNIHIIQTPFCNDTIMNRNTILKFFINLTDHF